MTRLFCNCRVVIGDSLLEPYSPTHLQKLLAIHYVRISTRAGDSSLDVLLLVLNSAFDSD